MRHESAGHEGAAQWVSVVIRSMNRTSLVEALDSVRAQTWPHLEVLVVNATGAPHAALPAGPATHRWRLVEEGAALSRSAAANLGLRQATGRWVCFLDDDDLWEPGHLRALVERLQGSSAVAAYAGVRCLESSETGAWREVMRYNAPFDAFHLLLENFLPIHAVLFDRAAALAACAVDETLEIFEDWDFWIQLSRLGPFEHVDQVSAVYRLNRGGSGLYGNTLLQQQSAERILEKWQERWTQADWAQLWRRGREALARNAALQSENASMRAEFSALQETIQALQGRIAALDAQVALQQQTQLRLSESLRGALTEYDQAMRLLRHEQFTVMRPLARHGKRALRRLWHRLPGVVQRAGRQVLRRVGRTALAGSVQSLAEQAVPGQEVDWRAVFDPAGKRPPTVLVFPVIDWHFRVQRPQHLAMELGARGYRVVYFSTTFAPGNRGGACRLLGSPAPGVHLVQLALPRPAPNIYEEVPGSAQVAALTESLQWLRAQGQWGPLISLVDLPFWRPVAAALPGNWLVYDCMDYHAGFSTNAGPMLNEEQKLLQQCDLLLTSSAQLAQRMQALAQGKPHALIRNGADVQHFRDAPATLCLERDGRKVVGYFGAISEWFDMPLVVSLAQARPHWRFVLVGATTGCDVSAARRQPNIELMGEVPYAELPGWVHGFDVCVIPFLLNELTACTNPVKVYEYLSAGKPVVATRLPELELIADQVMLAEGTGAFLTCLDQALQASADAERIRERRTWAEQHSWGSRVDQLEAALQGIAPKVSVVVLCYNNLELTRACLDALLQHSLWPDLELVLVDNASTDGTRPYLEDLARGDARVRLVLNDRNLGFAAGNNAGLEVATGEVLVLLNNDTQVSPGWVQGLVRHFARDPALGMVGPVTNNIGNEARIDVGYEDPVDMPAWASQRLGRLLGAHYDCRALAFFCVALRREVYRQVGGLDPAFGIGFFEDDDYCNRVRAAGWRLTIADDVFVHHHLSATFNQMHNTQRQALFERNRALYEKKWGPWVPHRYRPPEDMP